MRSFIIALLAKYNDEMEDVMSRECSTYVRKEKRIRTSNRKMLRKETDH
jgi:hypothetical protein